MRKLTSIPDFSNNIESMATTLRAMKDVIEQLAGLRQGQSLGAPSMFVQMTEPRQLGPQMFKLGDLWIKTNPDPGNNGTLTLAGNLFYWDGSVWHEIADADSV